MCKTWLLFVVLLLCVGSWASPGPITYYVSVDTSSISGAAGSLDFNFNPGPLVTQPASLQISSFAGGSLAGSPTTSGDVSGILPGVITFDNGFVLNDYFDGFSYGTKLVFNVYLYGPALSSPDGTSTSGSTFAFSMFSDAAGTIPVLTADTTDGFAITIDVNLDGTTTVTNYSSQTTVATVPEPASVILLGSAFGVVVRRAGSVRRRKA